MHLSFDVLGSRLLPLRRRGLYAHRAPLVLGDGRVQSVEATPTDVAQTASEVVEEHRAVIEAAGHEIAFDADRSIAPIETNPSRVRQILGCMIRNAGSCTGRGAVGVWVTRARSNPAPHWAGAWVTVNVSDAARGFPEREQHIVFQEFARRGLIQPPGWGPAPAGHVVDSFDVRMTLVSDPGRGSTFTMWLPVT